MSGLEASWASRAFNGLAFCSFWRFRSPFTHRSFRCGRLDLPLQTALWPAKECLLEVWHLDSNRVDFFDFSLWPVPGYGRGAISWQTFEQVFAFGPAWLPFWGLCLACAIDSPPPPPPPAPHAMDVIPTFTKNVMGHDVSS